MYDDIQTFKNSIKALTKRVSTIEYAIECEANKNQGHYEALLILAKRSGSSFGGDPKDAMLVGPHNKCRPLPVDVPMEEAPGIWRMTYDSMPEEDRLELLRRMLAIAEIRQARADRKKLKDAKEKAQADRKTTGRFGVGPMGR